MTGNRVEELERTVRELQATVHGLTDELVETKERLQHLEDGLDSSVDITESDSNSTPVSNNELESPSEDDAINNDGFDNKDNVDLGDDIIVA